MSEGLVYVGKIVEIGFILGADKIVSVTAVCGKGGRWKGVVSRDNLFTLGDLCLVYLPDSIVPCDDPDLKFMEKNKWRVKMCKFRGAPSECLIMPLPPYTEINTEVGDDVTDYCGVTKYHKPVPENMQGKAKGPFPSFIPKTDEPNYQSVPELVILLTGKPYYITEKADGSSSTAFKHKGQFGVCSRNWELEEVESNGYWKVANKYNLKERLPDGYAIQWETCGPGIQKNPMGLTEVDGFAFSGYNIKEQKYLEWKEFQWLLCLVCMPSCRRIEWDQFFYVEDVEKRGEGKYQNGKEREGVVIRSQYNHENGKPISFKVINLNYED